MTNYYIRINSRTVGPYKGIANARAAAIRHIKEGGCTYYAQGIHPAVSVSRTKGFTEVGGFSPAVVFINGEYRWNTWDFGNMSRMPIVNTDGTIRRS